MGMNRDTKRILDGGDTLVGNLVSPLGASGAWNGGQIITSPAANPDRIINLTGESQNGQMATVAVTAFSNPPTGENFSFPTLAGPLTARVEFGNGAQFQTAEIDVPIGGRSALPLVAAIVPTDIPDGVFVVGVEGGTQFTVPGGVLRVFGRNDSNLVTPAASLFENEQFGVPNPALIGVAPGAANIPRGLGPWWAGNPVTPLSPSETIPVPASMKATVTYGLRPSGERTRNTKTVWVYNALPGNTDQVITSSGHPAVYFVPAFAKSVTVYRNQVTNGGTVIGPTASVDVYLLDQNITPYLPLEVISIAAGAPSPVIDLPDTVAAIGILTGAAEVTQLCLVFEIGI